MYLRNIRAISKSLNPKPSEGLSKSLKSMAKMCCLKTLWKPKALKILKPHPQKSIHSAKSSHLFKLLEANPSTLWWADLGFGESPLGKETSTTFWQKNGKHTMLINQTSSSLWISQVFLSRSEMAALEKTKSASARQNLSAAGHSPLDPTAKVFFCTYLATCSSVSKCIKHSLKSEHPQLAL